MAAMTVTWHRRCYENQLSYFAQKQQERDKLIAECNKTADDLTQYWRQIEEAERRGKERFDRERFLCK